VVFVVNDLRAWLVGLLVDAGRRRLTHWVLGSTDELRHRPTSLTGVFFSPVHTTVSTLPAASFLSPVIDRRIPQADVLLTKRR